MRRVSTYTRPSNSNEVLMTPLIDCVFQLMIYFLWTAGFQVAEHSLPGGIAAVAGSAPSATITPPAAESDFAEVVVRVLYQDGNISWSVNDMPLPTLAEVRGHLLRIAEASRTAPVIVHPDPDVPLGAAINVYDLARLQGLRVAFATSSDTSPPGNE
jgi:biopolymer transport protein ExbD